MIAVADLSDVHTWRHHLQPHSRRLPAAAADHLWMTDGRQAQAEAQDPNRCVELCGLLFILRSIILDVSSLSKPLVKLIEKNIPFIAGWTNRSMPVWSWRRNYSYHPRWVQCFKELERDRSCFPSDPSGSTLSTKHLVWWRWAQRSLAVGDHFGPDYNWFDLKIKSINQINQSCHIKCNGIQKKALMSLTLQHYNHY